MQEIHTSLEEIGVKLAGLDDASMQLDRTMTSLQFIQISGLVEAVGLHQGGFHLIFTEVRERIDDAKIALGQLSQTIRQLSQLRSDRHTIDCAFKEYESECRLASNRFL